MKFRKKPVVIEAFQWSAYAYASSPPEWYFDAVGMGICSPERDGSLAIKTLEGVMRGEIGDMIIQGVKGEIYPCKPDIFSATYEPAEVSA